MDYDLPSIISSSELDDLISSTEESFEYDDFSTLDSTDSYQQQQQQQHYSNSWSYQNYQYAQYGYLPSPYNSYYMPSPPIDYQQPNLYNNYDYQMNNYNVQQQQATHVCEVCTRTFKSQSNLSRHYMSKTHLKRLTSKKASGPRVRKQKHGKSATDLSDDEKRFLWKLDDEIWQFLNDYEMEKMQKNQKQNEILPTPPLSPNGSRSFKKSDIKRNDGGREKVEIK